MTILEGVEMKKVLFLSFLLLFFLFSCSASPKEMFSKGLSLEKQNNKKEAREIFSKLCNKHKNKEACFHAGQLWADGNAVSKKNAKAVKFYKKACKMNYDNACLKLADMWFTGTGGVYKDVLSSV